MTGEQLVTLTIALYGAILATVLGIRELRAERRHISIFLEHITFYERTHLIIVNAGHRPITITQIGMELWTGEESKGDWDPVKRGALFASDPEPLPITLGDGESVTLPLSEIVSGYLLDNHMKAKISVYDAEGKLYQKYKRRRYDPKWGFYTKIDK